MQLRPYQEQIVEDTRKALRQHKRVLMQAPTGAGKTAITVFLMSQSAKNGKKSMFLVHQNELLFQTSKALWKQKLEHGVIASGRGFSKLPAQVASVLTLVNRLEKYEEPDLIIIDECHRSSAASYQKVLDAYPNAYVIGLTATPARTDGSGLDSVYTGIVIGPSVAQLIQAGFLAPYEIFAPPSALDISHINKKMGDYDKSELAAEVDKPKITGEAVATYKKYANGKRCVVMCITLDHARHVCDSYRAAGVSAEVIEGKMTTREREAMLDRLVSGETLVVCNVNLMIEGVDIPMIEVIQWLRPTHSLIVWMQGNGRGLRPSEGKTHLTILDQVGNWHKHGLPDDDREWSLEGKNKKSRKASEEPDLYIQQCGECFHIFKSGVDECPSCHGPVEKKTKREIEVIEGELQKIDIEQQRKAQRREQGSARTVRELVELGIRRKLKKPAAWAAITAASRQGRKPSVADFKEANDIYREALR